MLLTQPHLQKVLPTDCSLRPANLESWPLQPSYQSEDEATKIHRTWKVEIIIFITLRQHLLSTTKKSYELVPLFFQLTHLTAFKMQLSVTVSTKEQGSVFVSLLYGIMLIHENESSKM